MLITYIIGPAGSGKTTLTQALLEYLQHYNPEISVISINLDPGVQNLPYNPNIDIQDYITVNQIIKQRGLGPNGAMIAATDEMINYIEDIKLEIEDYNNPDLILVDTPGQMELFSFRDSGPQITNALGFGAAQRALLFCYDSLLCTKPNGLLSTILLATSVQYRFVSLPQINVLTKKDILSSEKLEMILDWIEDDFTLDHAIETMEHGMLRELTQSLNHLFRDSGTISELIPVSAKYNEGIEFVWGALQQVLNDDTSPYY